MTMAASTGMSVFFFFLSFESGMVGYSLGFFSFFLIGSPSAGLVSLFPVSWSMIAAGESSKPCVSYALMLFEAFLMSSEMAIAAIMQATGARTSMRRIMTQEK